MKKIKRCFKFRLFVWAAVFMLSMGGIVPGDANAVHAETTVYVTRTGAKYHAHKCGNGNYYPASLSEAQARGLTPCSKCFGSGGGYGYNYSAEPGGTGAAAKPARINKTSLILIKGQASRLKISNASQGVVWSSSKQSVAAVSANGRVAAKRKGKAVITAKIGDTVKQCRVTVEEPRLNLKSVVLNLKETKTLKMTGCKHRVKWSVSDRSVVKVNKGKITARDAGTARVTASVHGKKFTCRVTVKRPELQQIILGTGTLQMKQGALAEIPIRTVPAEAIDYYDIFVWSSAPSIVGVWQREYGDVICLESFYTPGNAEIVVSVGNLTAKCCVEVQEE
ncbi:Ig-like domain-containing protein [Lachnospiraceae bacterium 46-15]